MKSTEEILDDMLQSVIDGHKNIEDGHTLYTIDEVHTAIEQVKESKPYGFERGTVVEDVAHRYIDEFNSLSTDEVVKYFVKFKGCEIHIIGDELYIEKRVPVSDEIYIHRLYNIVLHQILVNKGVYNS